MYDMISKNTVMKCRLACAIIPYHMDEKRWGFRRGNIWYPKKRTNNIGTCVNNRNVAHTLTNDLRAMSGGLCVTHVCKEEDKFRKQLHTADRTSMVVQALIFDTRSLTWDEWSHSQILLVWGLSDPSIAELCERPQCFSMKLHCKTVTIWACLRVNFLNMPKSPYHA